MTPRSVDVVVATADRDLRRLLTALLVNDGHVVHDTVATLSQIRNAVATARPEVVLVDADLVTAAQVTAMLDAAGQYAGVIRIASAGEPLSDLPGHASEPVLARDVDAAELLGALTRAIAVSDAHLSRPRGRFPRLRVVG